MGLTDDYERRYALRKLRREQDQMHSRPRPLTDAAIHLDSPPSGESTGDDADLEVIAGTTSSLPPLADEVASDARREADPDRSESAGNAEPNGVTEANLVAAFLGKAPSLSEQHLDQAPSRISSAEEILTHLQRLYCQREGFGVELGFGELRLEATPLTARNGSVQLSVQISQDGRCLLVRAYLPFNANAALNLLRLYADNEYTGTICMGANRSSPCYIVRRKLDLTKSTIEGICSGVQQVLFEASAVLKEVEGVACD